MALKTFTLRLEESLYDKTKKIASSENDSINNFIKKLIAEKLAEYEEKEMYNAFSLVGQDKKNIEEYLQAQSEVVLEDE